MPSASEQSSPGPPRASTAQPSDIQHISRIERVCFGDPWPPEHYEAELTRTGSLLLVSRHDEAAVAYLNAWICHDEAQLLRIATAPTHKRKGHAAALLDALVNRCQAALLRQVFLEVRPSNRAALQLYAARGFAPAGRRPRYYADREDALLLRLDLAKLPG